MSLIEDIFKNGLMPPKYYNITFSDLKTVEDIFRRILDFYKLGAVILFGNEEKKSIDLVNMTENNRLILKQYMMSFGIEPKIVKYSAKDINDIYTNFSEEISQVDNNIKVILSKENSEYFTNVKLQLSNNYEVIKKFNDYIKNNQELLDLLDVYLSKDKLENFKFKVKVSNLDVYVIRFYFI